MDNLYKMLDHMTNIGILVISEDDRTVLYCNKTFCDAFTQTEPGQTSKTLFSDEYHAMFEEQLRMLAQTDEKMKTNRCKFYIPEFGGMTEVSIDKFLWNEKQNAYILYFCPRYLSENEKFKDESESAVNSALATIYPVVVAVNLTGNKFMVFETDDEIRTKMSQRGYFNENFRDELLVHVHPEEREEFARKCDRDFLYQTFETGEREVHLEFRIKKDDGKYRWTALRFVRIHTADQGRMSCIALMRGVDYRMHKQMKLQEALHATYSAIPGGVVEFIVDEKMTILNVNNAFCELAGKKREDYTNGYKEHIHKKDREETAAIIKEAAKEGKPFDVVYRVTHGQTGKINWVQCRGVKIDEINGLPVYLGIRLDVTALKKAQIDLLEERARADLAVGGIGILRYEYDKDEDTLKLYYQLDASGELHEKLVEHYCEGIRERDEVCPEDVERILSVFLGEDKSTTEVRLKNNQMEHYNWYRMKSSCISDSAGKNYIVGIFENIEKERNLRYLNQNLQKQIEDVVRDSYKRIYVIDALVNKCMIMFMDAEKYKRPIIMDLQKMITHFEKKRIHPEDLDNFRSKCIYISSEAAFKKKREEIYFEMRVRDGYGPEYHWYSLLIKPVTNEKQKFVCLIKCIDESKRQDELEQKIKEQIKYKKFSEKIIDSLGILVEFRDGDSGAHIMRTRQLTDILLNYLKEHVSIYDFTDEEIEKIATASAMHDVGKISIPDAILNKPGRFTPEEFDIMKLHTVKGYNILKKLDLGQDEKFNRYCLEICRWHHERFDGKGYPDQLKGDQIPIWSQIVGIVDVYDALVSPRVYKAAYTHEKAVEMIMNGECGNFNPDLLTCLQECKDQLRACYE